MTDDGRADDPAPGLRRFSTVRPGETFADRYRIEDRLGSGGTGEVFRAHDRVADAAVALKILFPRPDDTRLLARLRRELDIVRSIDEPGMVRVHDIGEHDGLLYLVLEYLEGETLRDRIRRRGPLPAEEAIEVLTALARTLAAAHRRGVIHRDIKPANVFLARPDGAGVERVVLLDFGTARRPSDASITATGEFLGTPAYLAPEQARGDVELRPAVDVYALGTLAWEMLSGRTVFGDSGPMQAMRRHIEERPTRRPPFPDATPRWLTLLVLGMLEKDPGDRPADGVALVALLEARRAPRSRRRTRRAVAGAVGVIAAVAFGAAWIGLDPAVPAPYEVRSSPLSDPITFLDRDGNEIPAWLDRMQAITGADPRRTPQNDDGRLRATVLDAGAWPDTTVAALQGRHGDPWRCDLFLVDGRDGAVVRTIPLPRLAGRDEPPRTLDPPGDEVLTVDFIAYSVEAAELDGDGRHDEVVLSAGSSQFFPTQVLALDPLEHDDVLLDHWSMGNVRARPFDLDGDGTDEIVVFGADNGHQRAAITVLDPGGDPSTPGIGPPGHRDIVPAEVAGYPVRGWTIRFPRIHLARDPGSKFHFLRGRTMEVAWDPATRILRVLIQDGSQTPPRPGANTMTYVLDLDERTIRIEWTDHDRYYQAFLDDRGNHPDPWGVVEGASLDPYAAVLIAELEQWNVEGVGGWESFDLDAFAARFSPVKR